MEAAKMDFPLDLFYQVMMGNINDMEKEKVHH